MYEEETKLSKFGYRDHKLVKVLRRRPYKYSDSVGVLIMPGVHRRLDVPGKYQTGLDRCLNEKRITN